MANVLRGSGGKRTYTPGAYNPANPSTSGFGAAQPTPVKPAALPSPTPIPMRPLAGADGATSASGPIAPYQQFAGAPGAIGTTTLPGQAPADPGAVDLWNYVKQFNESLASQRGNIDRDLQQALGSVAQRRAMAGQVISTLPQTSAKAYEAVSGAMDAAQGVANAALPDDNKGAGAGVLAPQRIALQMNQAGSVATAPLLQLSAQAREDSGAAALRAAAMEAKGAVDASERDMALNLLSMKREDAQRAEDHSWDREKLMFESDQRQKELTGAKLQEAGFTGDEQEYQQILGSAPARYAQKLMTEGFYEANGKREKASPTDIIERYAATNPKLVQALAVTNDAMKLAYDQWLAQNYPATQ